MTNEDALRQFFAFYNEVAGTFCDFTPVQDKQKWLNKLLVAEAQPYFKVIGKQKSGSLICFWLIRDELSPEDQPVVWLDSEGSPRSVFASDFQEFLSLLPYDTGAIYDLIAAWDRAENTQVNSTSVSKKFSKKRLQMYVEMCQNNYTHYNEFVTWLRETLGIEPALSPATVVKKTIQEFPSLNTWLASFTE